MSQEYNNNILDLLKQKFYPYKYMSDFEKFKEQLPGQKFVDNVLKVWSKFKMKMKDYHDFYLN